MSRAAQFPKSDNTEYSLSVPLLRSPLSNQISSFSVILLKIRHTGPLTKASHSLQEAGTRDKMIRTGYGGGIVKLKTCRVRQQLLQLQCIYPFSRNCQHKAEYKLPSSNL